MVATRKEVLGEGEAVDLPEEVAHTLEEKRSEATGMETVRGDALTIILNMICVTDPVGIIKVYCSFTSGND